MFIRKTKTRTMQDGTCYYAFRLVHNVRYGNRVKQETLLNLGSKFWVRERDWPSLCSRIQELLDRQHTFLKPLPKRLEEEAERIVAQLLDRRRKRLEQARLAKGESGEPVWKTVDVSSTKMRYPRSVGVEHVALWALEQLRVLRLLRALNFTDKMTHAVLGLIIGRLAKPASEHATYKWLCTESSLEEFLGASFARMSLKQLYRASDALMKVRDEIEDHVFEAAMTMFDLERTVTLFDLTNTYLEGDAEQIPLAKHGHSKERRSDCRLITLAVVLDGSGFVRRSRLFEGNVFEGHTLQQMLTELNVPREAVVVMDRGVATEENVQWLRQHTYKYVVVSRERKRIFDPGDQEVIELNDHLEVYEVRAKEEVRIYCRSSQRGKKERAMIARRRERFETRLQQLHEGLSRPRTRKRLDLVRARIDRMKRDSDGIGQHYEIEVVADEEEKNAVEVKWTAQPKDNTMWTDPGTYILRSNVKEYTTEQFWRTFVLLTDLEAVFRSLKSELGLRPVFHRTQHRVEGHLFITVLAYQVVQVIRTRLRQKNVTWCWNTIRNHLSPQRRATYTQKLKEGGAVHTRVTSEPEFYQREIYEALDIDPIPLPTVTTTV